MFDSKKAAKKQAGNSFLLQYANMQRKKNILEQQLATRHARGQHGYQFVRFGDAANNRLIDEAFDEIENDNMAFLAEQDAKADGFNLKYRKICLIRGLPLPEKF